MLEIYIIEIPHFCCNLPITFYKKVTCKASLQEPNTLDSFLKFLREKESPVSSVLDLKSLLISEQAEKIELENGLRQMGIEMQGIRSVINLNPYSYHNFPEKKLMKSFV